MSMDILVAGLILGALVEKGWQPVFRSSRCIQFYDGTRQRGNWFCFIYEKWEMGEGEEGMAKWLVWDSNVITPNILMQHFEHKF